MKKKRRGIGSRVLAACAGLLILTGSLAGCRSTAAEDPVTEALEIDSAPDPGWPVLVADESIEVDLPEPFVKLVDLDRLRIGMTKQEVLAIFPDPYEIELRGSDELWQYGFAQLIFRGNRLRDWFDL